MNWIDSTATRITTQAEQIGYGNENKRLSLLQDTAQADLDVKKKVSDLFITVDISSRP